MDINLPQHLCQKQTWLELIVLSAFLLQRSERCNCVSHNRVVIWPFFKQFSRNKRIWSFGIFLAFFQSWRKKNFLGIFWQNFNKTYNILWYFKIVLIHFGKFSFKIWPLFGLFHHLRIWPFLTLLMAKFGLFYFLGPGNPVSQLRKWNEMGHNFFRLSHSNNNILYWLGTKESKN
jgi:hypothetical protein